MPIDAINVLLLTPLMQGGAAPMTSATPASTSSPLQEVRPPPLRVPSLLCPWVPLVNLLGGGSLRLQLYLTNDTGTSMVQDCASTGLATVVIRCASPLRNHMPKCAASMHHHGEHHLGDELALSPNTFYILANSSSSQSLTLDASHLIANFLSSWLKEQTKHLNKW
jgi:hypothetical protein